jgi:aerobic C4-dicarboxylate transport protein
MTAEAIRPAVRHKPWYRILYVQVLIAIGLGILIGNFFPDLGKSLKPLGDGFIALIKMMIAPVISAPSCTGFPRWAISSASAVSA